MVLTKIKTLIFNFTNFFQTFNFLISFNLLIKIRKIEYINTLKIKSLSNYYFDKVTYL